MGRGALGVVLVFALWPVSASAADNDPLARGIDPVSFKLALSHDSLLTLEGPTTMAPGSFRAGLWADYNAGLLGLKLGDEKLGDLIPARLDLHIFGSWAVSSFVEVALEAPFTVWQDDDLARIQQETGFPTQGMAGGGVGDLRALVKGRILSADDWPVELAVTADIRFPTGDGDSFLGERGLVMAPRVSVARRFFGDLRLVGELSYVYRTAPGQFLNLYVGDEWRAGLGASYDLPEVGPIDEWTLMAEALMATPARAPFTFSAADALKSPLEVLGGLRVHLGGGVYLTLGGGTGIAGQSGFGREAYRVFVGVTFTRVRDERDENDRDADGVLDIVDECPDTPGSPELDGCPDRDADGILDVEDACPDEPGPASNDGCPVDPPNVSFDDGELEFRGSIHFDYDKASIKRISIPVVEELALILKAHPEIKKVRVDGHTDSDGDAAYNQSLSQRRCQSVVNFLVRAGIDESRLEPKGWGESKPIASNRTRLGKAKNRRVEFIILELEESEPEPEPEPEQTEGEPEVDEDESADEESSDADEAPGEETADSDE